MVKPKTGATKSVTMVKPKTGANKTVTMVKPKTGANKSVTMGEHKLQRQNNWPYGTGRAKNWCEQIGHYNIVNSKTGANKLVTMVPAKNCRGKQLGHIVLVDRAKYRCEQIGREWSIQKLG